MRTATLAPAPPKLTAALLGHDPHKLAKALAARRPAPAPPKGQAGPLQAATPRRLYDLAAWGDHPATLRGLFASAGRLGGAVLALGLEAGVTPALRDQVWAAFRLGVPRLAAFLHLPPGTGGEAADRVEIDLRRMLHEQGFPGDDVPVVRGDAWSALCSHGRDDRSGRPLDELAAHLDAWPDGPPADAERPLRFTVESAHLMKQGRYAVCRGVVEQGRVAAGDRVNVVGPLGEASCVPVLEVRGFHRELRHGAAAGDRVTVLLRGALLPLLGPGVLVAADGGAVAARSFDALLHFDNPHRAGVFCSGLVADLAAPLREAQVRVRWDDGPGWRRAGDCVAARVEMRAPGPLAAHAGLCFTLRSRGAPLASGVVVPSVV
jgi:elongation factor Tu